jgi:PPM family protein phosphatase
MDFKEIRPRKEFQGGNMKESDLRIGYLTHPGRQRLLNEDSLYVDKDLGLFVLADGMGGHNAGEVASKLAVEVTARSMSDGLSNGKAAEQCIREAIATANKTIFEKSLNNPAWEAMGPTVLIALATHHEVIIGHAGDSRAYFIRQGEIQQLTNDHTFVFEWLKEGQIQSRCIKAALTKGRLAMWGHFI